MGKIKTQHKGTSIEWISRTDLIKSVVNWMKNPDPKIRQNCCQCISQIIKTDSEGHRSLEVVQLVGDLIRRQKCNSDPKIIESLFDLSFPDISLPTKEGNKTSILLNLL